MGEKELKALLDSVREGRTTPDEAVQQLRSLPFEDLGFAKVDHHRKLRVGFPEIIFGPGKDPEHIAAIFATLAERGNNVLATRVTAAQFAAIKSKTPQAEYSTVARAAYLRQKDEIVGKGTIAIVCAGTSDVPIAEEAVLTAELMGNHVEKLYDVGVAGLHRLLAHKDALTKARVVVVCAGMEGALPSVVGGLVGVPVIAVPTSVGYGASFGGVAALLGMMNSCASNVSVVNIDNGFGAAYVASMINRL